MKVRRWPFIAWFATFVFCVACSQAAPPTTQEIGSPESPVPSSPDLNCSDCNDGFVHDGVIFETSCALLAEPEVNLAQDILASGELRWTDHPVEIRTIVGVPASEFVAIEVGPDNCWDNGLRTWFIASSRSEFNLELFCEIVDRRTLVGDDCG